MGHFNTNTKNIIGYFDTKAKFMGHFDIKDNE